MEKVGEKRVNRRNIVFGLLLLVMLNGVFATSLLTGLTSYWKLNEADNNAIDSVGTNNGVPTGVNYSQAGKIGTSYGFDAATNDVVIINNETNFDFMCVQNADFTMAFWIKTTEAGNRNIITKQTSGSIGLNFSIDGGYPYFYLQTDGSNYEYYQFTNTINDGAWHHIVITDAAGTIKILVDANTVTPANTGIGSYTGSNPTGSLQFGRRLALASSFGGNLDEIGIWNRALVSSDINLLYAAGAGLTYPFGSPSTNPLNLVYQAPLDGNKWSGSKDINFSLQDTNGTLVTKMKLYYSQTAGAKTNLLINDTNLWDNNAITCNEAVPHKFAVATNCGYPKWNTIGITDGNYYIDTNFYNTDWNLITSSAKFLIDNNAPFTWFNSTATTGGYDFNFKCYDVDGAIPMAGCNTVNYRIDAGAWTSITSIDGNQINFFTSTSGTHTLHYYSTDTAGNTQTTQDYTYTVSGLTKFTFFDENDSTGISATIDFNGTDYIGTSFTMNSGLIAGAVNEQKVFTITKAGYGTRYYQVDMNNASDLNIGFALLPTSLDQNILFRFYKLDEITAYSNIYVQVKNTVTDFILGRLKTDATGLISFGLDQNSTHIQFDMNNGENTYNAVTVTINKPKNEQTLVTIDGNWNYQLSGLASFIDMNIGTPTKVFAIYSNTVASYTVLIGSNSESPLYVTRKYDIQVLGDTATYTLQPYLFDSANALTTTLYTINAYTNQSIGGITIKIYRTLPIVGKTLIEQTVTDSKGQSIVYLLLNQTYDFELNVGVTVIRTETYTISGTSSSIYFKMDPGYNLNTTLTITSIFAFFTPGKNWLGVNDANVSANVSYGENKNSITVSNIVIKCTNDTNTLFQDNFASPAMNFVQTYDYNLETQKINGVSFDGNYPINCTMTITLSDGNTLLATQSYVVNSSEPQQVLGMSLRPFFGCAPATDPNIPCPMMILAALFITMMAVTGIMVESGFTYPEFAGILFLIGLGFFAFFTWIPPMLYAIILVIGLLIYVALGVRRI
jgi:hypothetical protein